MAGIPTYNRQENLNALPNARVTAAGSADSYGAGVINAGQGMINVGLKMAQEYEYAKALSALNEFQKQVDTLHLDPEKGLYNTRKLGGANGMTTDAEAQMKDIAGKIYSELGSPYIKKVFADQSQKIAIAQSRANSKWEAAQIQAYKTQEAEAAINNGYNKIALYYDDEEQIALIREQMLPHLEYQLTGMSDEAREEAMRKFENNIATIQAGRVIENSPLDAVAWIEANKDRFTPETYDKIHNAAEKKAEPFEIEAIRDDLLKKFGNNEAAAHKYIIENYEGDKEKKIMSAVEAEYSDRRRIRDQQKADWLDGMRNSIATAGSLSAALSIIARGGGEPQHRRYLENYAKSIYGGGDSDGSGTTQASSLNKLNIRYAIDKFIEKNPLDGLTNDERFELSKKCIEELVSSGLLEKYPIKESDLESMIRTQIYNAKTKELQEEQAAAAYKVSAIPEIKNLFKDTFGGDLQYEQEFSEQLQGRVIEEQKETGRTVQPYRMLEIAQEMLTQRVVVGINSGWFLNSEVTVNKMDKRTLDKMNAELATKGLKLVYNDNIRAFIYVGMDGKRVGTEVVRFKSMK